MRIFAFLLLFCNFDISYDVRAVDRGVLGLLSNHAKTVTCLSTADDESRLLSGSVDQTVKGLCLFVARCC